MVWEELGGNFLLGGFFIALVLAIGKLIGPFLAGIIAALPVRLATTLFLGGLTYDSQFVFEMIRGALPSSLGALCLIITLALTVRRLGVFKAFLLGCLVCLIVVYTGFSVMVLL